MLDFRRSYSACATPSRSSSRSAATRLARASSETPLRNRRFNVSAAACRNGRAASNASGDGRRSHRCCARARYGWRGPFTFFRRKYLTGFLSSPAGSSEQPSACPSVGLSRPLRAVRPPEGRKGIERIGNGRLSAVQAAEKQGVIIGHAPRSHAGSGPGFTVCLPCSFPVRGRRRDGRTLFTMPRSGGD